MNVNDKIALAIGQAHLQKIIAEAQLDASNAKVVELEARLEALAPKAPEPDEPEREQPRTVEGDGDGPRLP